MIWAQNIVDVAGEKCVHIFLTYSFVEFKPDVKCHAFVLILMAIINYWKYE